MWRGGWILRHEHRAEQHHVAGEGQQLEHARRPRSTSCPRARCGARVVPTPASFGSTKYRKATTERMNSREGDDLPPREPHARHLLLGRRAAAPRGAARLPPRSTASPRLCTSRAISLALTSSAQPVSCAIPSSAATARPTRASAGARARRPAGAPRPSAPRPRAGRRRSARPGRRARSPSVAV